MDLDNAFKRMCAKTFGLVCLLQEVESEFDLWKELVPKVNREVVVGASKDGNEMRFEVLDSHLRNVMAMVVRLNKFKLACFVNELLHAVGALIVKDVLLGDNSCFLDAMEESKIGTLHFGVLAA